MRKDIAKSKDNEQRQEQVFLFMEVFQWIDVENGEIGSKTKEQNCLWYKCIMI